MSADQRRDVHRALPAINVRDDFGFAAVEGHHPNIDSLVIRMIGRDSRQKSKLTNTTSLPSGEMWEPVIETVTRHLLLI